ncbi:hypothetical protein Tco_0814561 [Tanacetum coccineum]
MPRGTTQVVTRGASNDWCQMCRYEVRGGRASVRGTVAVRGVSTRQYEVRPIPESLPSLFAHTSSHLLLVIRCCTTDCLLFSLPQQLLSAIGFPKCPDGLSVVIPGVIFSLFLEFEEFRRLLLVVCTAILNIFKQGVPSSFSYPYPPEACSDHLSSQKPTQIDE